MACTLDPSYIQNSHPLILEKLKNCGDLSDSQITAVQSLLLSGNTAYGNPSTWNEQTVEQLSILAVYFKSDLCNTLSFNVRRKFFSVLRKQKIPMKKLRTFFTECNSESATVSNITAVTIADASFPFGFNSTQFDLYLDIAVLQNNLAAITEKVVDTSFQTVILNKLNQIYPSGLNDGVLQLLGSASRVATTDDISKWNITIIDTLSSLMDSNGGLWEPEKSKAVIMRYLSMGNPSLGSTEINVVGSNICTLDISVLESITAESLKAVLSPDLSSCSIEQKSALYIIANSSFSNQRSNAKTYYQLMSPYLGGAPLEDIQALSTHNISMDITVFTSLSSAVLKALNVMTAQALMGVNVADLKLFEHSSVVQSWVSQQNQSDLDMLNIGIIKTNSNNYTAIISTATPSTRTATDTAISSVTNFTTMTTIINIPATTNTKLTTTAFPTTSFKITPSIGTNVNTPATTNTILTTTASPTKGFEISTSVGTNVNTPATTNTSLTTTASPTTRFEITPSIGTNVNTLANTNASLTTTHYSWNNCQHACDYQYQPNHHYICHYKF
ncbi:mesothelin-like protein [Pangasianodon hypophthalmus]|uniref:mesothelin-like protein n=1 Tax=Pangasianodon hypophthalmus TaxID=310915 RepID=UPI0023073C3E|nr:mesothelin-like protein [Pangasianodon hypophthalmus]XP_053092564.1 mesothelin-like protein [Pangasianodon hypophthalmus]